MGFRASGTLLLMSQSKTQPHSFPRFLVLRLKDLWDHDFEGPTNQKTQGTLNSENLKLAPFRAEAPQKADSWRPN